MPLGLDQIGFTRMRDGLEERPDYYTITPVAKRLPTVGCLALAFAVGDIAGRSLWWVGIVAFMATLIACVALLHFVFRQPVERLLQYREYSDR
jgi:hypothetical protein